MSEGRSESPTPRGYLSGMQQLRSIISITLIIIGIVLFILKPQIELKLAELFLSAAITIFACVEGFSTFSQLKITEKRHLIEDYRNELEKGYGPLYSLFNPIFMDSWGYSTSEGVAIQITSININKSEKEKLDFIFSNYPFMFKPEIYNYWRTHLQHPSIEQTEENPTISLFAVDEAFIKMISDEYHRRLDAYNNLLGKKSASE